ncbi:MAG TPA: hypothetical protein DGG94_10305 [Micromonosporaceae bacterium]|nr:hypothetical protein [Micromonosporaceae bacterium]HCU50174.1 hypothetical protein [Micromonosporaceae bacterium]
MGGRFPVVQAPADFRFNFGLTADVAHVIGGYGFPNIMSFYDGAPADFDRLQRVLAGFIYSTLGGSDVDPDTTEGVDPAARTYLAATTAIAGRVAEPVEFRLIGSPRAVRAALEVLGHVFTLTYTSDPYPTRDGRVRLYLTGARLAPYKGGLK